MMEFITEIGGRVKDFLISKLWGLLGRFADLGEQRRKHDQNIFAKSDEIMTVLLQIS